MHPTISSPTNLNRATALLAAASAGLLAQTASGSTVNEGADFSSVFATPTPLPAGTDQVTGVLVSGGDNSDVFTIPGLLGGSSINLSANWTGTGFMVGGVYNSSDTFLFPILGSVPGATGTALTVPADGVLKIQMGIEASTGNTIAYTVTLAVPEAGTTSAAVAVGGLAALLELRRRRRSA